MQPTVLLRNNTCNRKMNKIFLEIETGRFLSESFILIILYIILYTLII